MVTMTTTTTTPPAISNNNNSNNKAREVITWPNWSKLEFSKKQAEIVNCKSDRVFVRGGRYLGKDHLVIFMAQVKMFDLWARRDADPSWDRLGPKVIVMMLAPTEKNAVDLWKRFIDSLPPIPGIAPGGNKNIHIKNDERVIELLGGDIVIYWETTTQAKNIRGRACDILCVTECAFQDRGDLYDVAFPCCLRAGYAGIIYLNSSPKGKGHWFDAESDALKRGEGYLHDLGFAYFQGDLYDNPRTSATEIMALKAILKANPYTGRREWLGWTNQPMTSKFLLGAGESLAFDPDHIRSCKLTSAVSSIGPYYVGIDMAGSGADHLAVVVIDGQGVIVRIERHASTGLEEVMSIIIRINNAYRPVSITYDANMGLLRQGSASNGRLVMVPLKPLQMNNTKKNEMVETLQQHLLARSIRIPDPDFYFRRVKPSSQYFIENLHRLDKEMHELVRFTLVRERQSRGQIITEHSTAYHKPADGTDDLLDGLIMCVSAFPIPYRIRALHKNEAPRDDDITEKRDHLVISDNNTNNNTSRRGEATVFGGNNSRRGGKRKLF